MLTLFSRIVVFFLTINGKRLKAKMEQMVKMV